ncbi:7427_t:CDS:2 [Acaulospora colombiana]|uniref:7427_t:CDS:1 n=1 Tax=Acaulospora colombiana TaxID=27376 RepID=A0ACA9K0F3_9GLOM|nr:7427_t:CDS:2 [Acaulospora colombiana]
MLTKLEQKQKQDDTVHVLEDSILHEASFNISSNIHAHSSEPKSSENKEIDEFLDLKNKGISGEINDKYQEISVTKSHEKYYDDLSKQELQQQIAVTTGGNNSVTLDKNTMQDMDISISDLSSVQRRP